MLEAPPSPKLPPTLPQDEEDEVQLMEGKPKRAPPTIPPIPPRSAKPKDREIANK